MEPSSTFSVPALLTGALRLLAFGSAAFAAAFAFAAVLAAGRFRRRPEPEAMDFWPAVTVLKPIKGTDSEMYENLASFLRQDYPRLQVLFCLHNSEDPALPLLKKLRQDFPQVDIDIVISKNRIGYNPKVNNLSNAYGFAKHDLLVISDSDIRVAPDFLRRAVSPFGDPHVGLLTCFYRSATGPGLGARLESLSVNAQFLPQALVAAFWGGLRFAMGAVMIVRRSAFETAGGLAALSEHLADDFVLGRAVAAVGYRVEFSNAVVDSIPERTSVAQQFAHQVRWSRTIRVCNPAGYYGSIAIHGGPLLLLHGALAGSPAAFAAFFALECWRALMIAWLHRSYLDNPRLARDLPLLPLSDVIHFGAWLVGLRSSTVLWRGEAYAVSPGGRLVPHRRKGGTLRATAV